MVILGANPDRFQQYCDQVRLEFKLYPNEIFNAGRRFFLDNVLKSKNILMTSYFDQLFSNQVINNIEGELKRLKGLE